MPRKLLIKLFLMQMMKLLMTVYIKDGCENQKNPFPGWKQNCTNYSIEYSTVDSGIKVTCTKFVSPYSPSMFVNYSDSAFSVQSYHFAECPPPNGSLTFGDILAGTKVLQLIYEVHQHAIELESNTFNGLLNIEKLVLDIKLQASIPSDIFSHLPKLASLYITGHFSSIPETLFSNLTSLKSLFLENDFTTLPEGLFRGLATLTDLNLRLNNLEALPSEIFSPLTGLRNLAVTKTKMTTFLPSYIKPLKMLTNLSLVENVFKQLEGGLFQDNENLINLDISFSKNKNLGSLPENLLQNLLKLKTISLRSCNLTHLPEKFFSYAPNLEEIYIPDNRLKNISSNFFSGNPRLTMIQMEYCDVANISVNAFSNQNELEVLDMGFNDIHSLPQGIFDPLVNLKVLILAGMFLESLPENIFSNLLKLNYLNLANNKLLSVKGQTPFGPGTNLEVLNISYNSLTTLPEINWEVYSHLTCVDLFRNILKSLSLPILKSNHVMFNASFNKIESVSVTDLKEYETLVASGGNKIITFRLQDNSFNCDCNLLSFVDYVKYSEDNHGQHFTVNFEDRDYYFCAMPQNLANRRLIDIDKEEFVCEVAESCPTPCTCYVRAMDNATIANCSNKDLHELPKTLPQNTTYLYFQKNHLTTLNNTNWTNLQLLDVSENQIESIPYALPLTLTSLNLQGNQLSQIPSSILTFFNKTNAKIYLGGNPLVCNCSIIDLKKLITLKSASFPDVNNIYCNTPEGSTSKLLMKMNDEDLCPVSSNSVLLPVVIICVPAAIALPVGLLLYYRNKQTVIAFLYVRFNCIFTILFDKEELDQDKVYDAFISYSSLNEDIAQALLDELENKDTFKLCIHGRDWLPGKLITDNIANSVHNSRRTIIVISKYFLESVWFQLEFHMAYYQMLKDKIDRLIIIIQGELPERSTLDKDLQCLLSTKTYLVWGERWFWEKLRYAMPHKKNRHMGTKTIAYAKEKLTNQPN